MPPRQPVAILLLNCAPIWDVPTDKSIPFKLLASACVNHVLATGAPTKSRCTVLGPAEPRIAEPAEQNSASKFPSTRMVTLLLTTASQRLPASLKAFRRSAP